MQNEGGTFVVVQLNSKFLTSPQPEMEKIKKIEDDKFCINTGPKTAARLQLNSKLLIGQLKSKHLTD